MNNRLSAEKTSLLFGDIEWDHEALRRVPRRFVGVNLPMPTTERRNQMSMILKWPLKVLVLLSHSI
jgi:hypothetical protein